MRALLMVLVLVVGTAGDAADRRLSARDEVARLQAELAAQRALLVRMLELQNECTAQMIRAAKGEAVQAPTLEAAVMTSVVSPPPPAPERERPAPLQRAARFAELTGRVHVISGGPAWVFVEDVKGPAGGGSVEIKQEDKQFSPRLVAVASGTRVSFPNLDVVYHNVFSLSPGQNFDLGLLRAGDPVKSVVMSRPGVVQIFCNLHARMSASVLVTPGPLLTRVAADGTFTLKDVPVGTHRVSAWAGGQALVTRSVEVGAGGGAVQFELKPPSDQQPHTNKAGQPYGSYED